MNRRRAGRLQPFPPSERRVTRMSLKTTVAFATIYLVWGTTFYAIRVGVQDVPPFLLAGVRFVIAGLALCAWTLARGERPPAARQWAAAFVIAFPIFVVDYGGVFWAERRVPSGVTAVMMATIPAFMALSEVVFLGTQRMTARLGAALLIGVGGVAVLVSRKLSLGGAPIDRVGAAVLLVAAIGWSVASALTRKLPLPPSKILSSGAQMLAGGVLLTALSAAAGEFRGFDPAAVPAAAWVALLYLVVFGSIVAFTAYVWLIHRESPTRVGTYAYVNPVVAVFVGWALGGETISSRTVLGSLLVLVSVVLITTMPPGKSAGARALDEAA